MTDERFREGDVPAGHEADARRQVLDAQDESMLQANLPDGRQRVIEPPVGTVGGPMTPPGDDVTTTQARTIPSGGGPADVRRMPDKGEQPSQTFGRSEDSGVGASPDPK